MGGDLLARAAARRRGLRLVVALAAVGLLVGAGAASAGSRQPGHGETAVAPVSLLPRAFHGRAVGSLQRVPTNLRRMWDGRLAGTASRTVGTRGVGQASSTTRALQAVAAITPQITSAPTNPSTSRNASFAFRGFDLLPRFQCSLDGAAYATCASPKAYTGLAYGSHTFRVRSRDLLGLLSAPATVTWSIVPPAPTILTKPANPSGTAASTFTFSSTEPTATFQCRLDTATFTACTSGFTATVAPGTHTFAVRAVVGAVAGPETTATWVYSTSTGSRGPVKGRILLVAATATEVDLAAIRQTLDYAGVPYDVLLASTTDLTAARLSDGTTGNYQAVILSTGNLTWLNPATNAYESAFTQAEWDTLWAYEAAFRVRQATLYTYPLGYPDDYGLQIQATQYVDTTSAPLSATLTDAGKQVFSYLNPATPVTWRNAWVYLATKRDANVTPLVQTASGQVIVSTRTYPDGRENLAITGQNAPYLLHSQILGYGVLNWVTRGVFVGQRQSTMNVQIDDLLIESDMWDVNANTDLTGLTYRMSATDWSRLITRQRAWQANPLFATVQLEWAFNGEGAYGDPFPSTSPYPNDGLTPAVRATPNDFWYTNHTYHHENLDLTDYATSLSELRTNQQAAALLFPPARYTPETFVQPDISGLTNANFLQAAFDAGIRTLISDTSRPEWNNPTPNAGFRPASRPEILVVPRHPTNLFYNIRTQQEWVDEYNWYFCTCSPSTSPWKVWPTAKTYQEILDLESDLMLSYLLKGDIDPLMFHQANAGTYDGVNSTLTDLVNATLTKYQRVFNVPVKGLNLRGAAALTARRMAFDASGVQATVVPCQSITVSVTSSADIPLTGVSAGTVETYGGQLQSVVRVDPGAPRTIAVTC